MTRKSAKYIGEQCQELSKELERKARWLTKKISRKLYNDDYMRVYDSYYDTEGLYLVFQSYDVIIRAFKPPETRVVDAIRTKEAVSKAAMVESEHLKLIVNSQWKSTECFIIYIPFQAYKQKRRIIK